MAKSLKVGDRVKVIAGDLKGTVASIVKVDKKAEKAMLKDLNIKTRHMRKTQFNPAGGKKDVHVGIHVSNLQKEGK
jgi:large subunit ribosomal protein L24